MDCDEIVCLPRPFEEWLAANGISDEDIVMWPKLEVDAEAGVIRVESIWREERDGGRPLPVVVGDSTCTVMREYRLLVPMGADLAAAWALCGEDRRRERMLREAFRGVRGASVVVAHGGRRLVFVTAGGVPESDGRRLVSQVEALLPGVAVSVVSGISAVLVGETPEESRRRGLWGD